MGTTLDMFKTGHVHLVTVLAIEGYPRLITDAKDPTKVQAAWAGTDYAANVPIGRASFELQNHQAVTPWSGLAGGGTGVATIIVKADRDDYLGIDIAKTAAAGGETYLTSTINHTATTIPVYDTSTFPSDSGELYIGNECVEYSARTSQTFTVSKRGKYCPLTTPSGGRMAAHHRAGFIDFSVNVEPAVTQYRRTWEGAVIAIYTHRVVNPLTGLLDTKAQAQRIYAGVIDEPLDDADLNATVIKCQPYAERIRSGVLFRDQFRATIRPGLFIGQGARFSVSDFDGSSGGVNDGFDLDVVVSGASGAYQVNEGFYRPDEICSFLNAWLAANLVDGHLVGTYSLTLEPTSSGTRTRVHAFIPDPGSGGGIGVYRIMLPRFIAILLGFMPTTAQPGGFAFPLNDSGAVDTTFERDANDPPLALFVTSAGSTTAKFRLAQSAGIAIDQADWIPSSYALPGGYGTFDPVCLFMLKDGTIFIGAIVESAPPPGSSVPTRDVIPLDWSVWEKLRIEYDLNQPAAELELVQVLGLQGTAGELLPALFYSTGSGHNGSSDTLPFGVGLGVPGELLGTAFDDALAASPSNGARLSVWLKGPIEIRKLLDNDLVILGLYLVWKNGGYYFAEFSTPIAASSVLALSESNKASQGGTQGSEKPTTVRTTQWAKQIIRVEYDYDWTQDKYRRSPQIVEDRASIDNAGNDVATATLYARNIHPDDVTAAVNRLRTRLPFFTQPFHKIRRSISLVGYEDLAPLDVVTVTDDSARDPTTGARRVSSRPALLFSHAVDLGGANADGKGVRGLSGEVELWLSPLNRAVVYSPSALVDHTATGGGFTQGYNSGTKTLRTFEHEHTESTAALKDAEYFEDDDAIFIVEVDPTDPDAAEIFSDTVAGVSGKDVTLTTGFTPTSGKRYRILTQRYADAQASQQANAYQADDVDARIQDLAPPYRYEIPKVVTFTSEDTSKRAELVPVEAYGDGVGLDTGHQRAMIRALNQGHDYKTAHQSPSLTMPAATNAVGDWLLTHIRLVYVGIQIPGAVRRALRVSPNMRSTSGSDATVRVSLCPARPVDTTRTNVTRPTPFVEATFTTDVTTFITPDEQELDLGAANLGGWAWVVIECGIDAECRDLARCIEGVRT